MDAGGCGACQRSGGNDKVVPHAGGVPESEDTTTMMKPNAGEPVR